MYVLFEGIDTCGKSTQIELLSDRFDDVILTKEPGGTPLGQQLREILLQDRLHSKRAELLLFLADRAEHYIQIIKPNMDKLILSDRGFLSGISYALANGDFVFEELLELNRFALENHLPNLVILFIADQETLMQRTSAKTLDGIELRGLEYLLQVQDHMHQSLQKLSIPYLLINASEEIEKIHQKIYTKILEAILEAQTEHNNY
jgi:dTMP kinase